MRLTKRRILTLGPESVAHAIAARIQAHFSQQYEYVGCYSGDSTSRPGLNGDEGLEPLSEPDPISAKVIKVLEHTKPHEVYCAYFLPYHIITDLILNYQSSPPIDFKLPPEVYEKLMGKLRANVDGKLMPSVSLREPNLSNSHRILKRFMDMVLSGIMLLCSLPLFVLVPILIKLTSRGPVLHTQIRAGENGYPFKLYKFRSMVVNAENLLSHYIDLDHLQEPVFKLANDARVTWIGRILRRTSMDELPQIFNVLRGEMSWVGPRPEEVRVVKKYNAYYKERLKAKPGITGLQQIQCRGVPSMEKRMTYDMYYIENQSLWLDIKILCQSIGVVLSRQGAW